MQFDDLYKKLINGYVVEEGLFDVAKGVAGAVATDIAPTASRGARALMNDFKKGSDGKLKLEKPISIKKDMDPEEVKAIINNIANLGNEVEEDLGYPIVYKGETLYYLAHDDENLTVTAANGETRGIPLEGLELDVVPMDQEEDAESSPGRVKRSGASCKGSVTKLRKMAKKYGGEKGKMYHWCANMKEGGKSESEESKKKGMIDRVADKISDTLDIGKDWKDGSVIKSKPLVGVFRRGAKIANRVGAEALKSGINMGKALHKGATEGGAYKRKSLRKRVAELEAENKKKKSESEEDAEKKVSKTRSKCQAKAKRKYDVWPSAYASGYVQKCVNRGGNIK